MVEKADNAVIFTSPAKQQLCRRVQAAFDNDA